MSREYFQQRSRLRRNRPGEDDAREMEYRVQTEPEDWTAKRGVMCSALMLLGSLLGFVLFRAAADPQKEFVLLAFIAGNFAWYVPRREAACIGLLLAYAAAFDYRMAAYVVAPVCSVTLAQQVVRHEVYLWTSAPTPLRIRDRIRGLLESHLRTSARVPLITTLLLIFGRAAIVAGSVLQNLYLAIGWLIVLIAIVRVMRLGGAGRALLWEKITSFWTYNLRDRVFVNVFRSPAGSTAHRAAIAYLSVLILSAPLSSPCLLLDDMRSGHIQPLFEDEDLPRGELSIGDILIASGFFWSFPHLLWYTLPAAVGFSTMVIALSTVIRTTHRIGTKYGEANTFESTVERLNKATPLVGVAIVALAIAANASLADI